MKIALLGKIPKGDEARKDFSDWKIEYEQRILAKVPGAQFLNGDLIKDDKGPELCVGHDLWVIRHADMIVVDAQIKIGAGTAQEMVFAKLWKKPLVSVIPPNTHHRRTNVVFEGTAIEDWVNPFMLVASDYVAGSVEDAAEWVLKYASGDIPSVKGIEAFENRIPQFESSLPDIVKKYTDKGW